MIHELRSYRLKPGKAAAYLGLLAREGLPHVTRHLPLLGYWLTETGRLNVIHHLWAYADWEERGAARAGLATEAAWNEGFIPEAFQWVEEQENLFLTLTRSGPAYEAALAARRRPHAARPAGEPLMAAEVAALSFCAAGPALPASAEEGGGAEGGVIAEWTVASGAAPGRIVTLHPRGAVPAPPATVAPGRLLRHEIIRPLAFSPL